MLNAQNQECFNGLAVSLFVYPQSRIYDIVGCSRERRYYRVHNQLSSVIHSSEITEKQKKNSICIYMYIFWVVRRFQGSVRARI